MDSKSRPSRTLHGINIRFVSEAANRGSTYRAREPDWLASY